MWKKSKKKAKPPKQKTTRIHGSTVPLRWHSNESSPFVLRPPDFRQKKSYHRTKDRKRGKSENYHNLFWLLSLLAHYVVIWLTLVDAAPFVQSFILDPSSYSFSDFFVQSFVHCFRPIPIRWPFQLHGRGHTVYSKVPSSLRGEFAVGTRNVVSVCVVEGSCTKISALRAGTQNPCGVLFLGGGR